MSENIGETGVKSIRLSGMRIDELPIAEAAITKQQWPEIIKKANDNSIGNIKAQYPKQSVAWIKGAVRECEHSIKRIRALSSSQQTMIDDYTGHISLCEYRDKENHRINKSDKTEDEKKSLMKELNLRFPPYNVEAMRIQIKQCKEAIERCDGVIDKEHKSISELRELLVKCTSRDNKLKALGESV